MLLPFVVTLFACGTDVVDRFAEQARVGPRQASSSQGNPLPDGGQPDAGQPDAGQPPSGPGPAQPPAPALVGDWNLDISSAPVDRQSADYIAFINTPELKQLHPDCGREAWPGSDQIFGMPVIRVDRNQPKTSVEFYFAAQSDGVDHSTGRSFPFYPIPDRAITTPRMIQGGEPGIVDLRGIEDRHMIILQTDDNLLYELYSVFYDQSAHQWLAGSGAFFDLNNPRYRRPEGWTSADASGMAMYPGFIQYEEVYGADEMGHAMRATVRATNGYVYPASHHAGDTPGALPIGARLRLKANVDISRFPAPVQKIFRAMKKYGLIVTDNGRDMDIGGTFDPRWDNDVLNPAFHALTAADFEVVELGFRQQ